MPPRLFGPPFVEFSRFFPPPTIKTFNLLGTLEYYSNRGSNILIYIVNFDFGLILHFKDQIDRQTILQDNTCHVEIHRVYRFAKIGHFDHLAKFINIRTLQRHSNYFSTQNQSYSITLLEFVSVDNHVFMKMHCQH